MSDKDTTDPERAEFERWVNTERPSLWSVVTTYLEHADVHMIHSAWLAWKARAEQESAELKRLREQLAEEKRRAINAHGDY